MKSLKTAFLSLVLLALSATASGQSSTPDSCICYTDAQDARCLECLINAPKRISQIETLQDEVSIRLAELELAGELITEQGERISDLEAKLSESERKRAVTRKLFFGALTVIAVETIVIFTGN